MVNRKPSERKSHSQRVWKRLKAGYGHAEGEAANIRAGIAEGRSVRQEPLSPGNRGRWDSRYAREGAVGAMI